VAAFHSFSMFGTSIVTCRSSGTIQLGAERLAEPNRVNEAAVAALPPTT
jgi:hypothetical protein